MNDTIIPVQGLSKTYGFGPKKVEAVRGIDFEVGRGEIFGLVGPDGAGKTTTMQMLCGILTPARGQAMVAGVDL
jgi:ABC-2 type transport system ATP-binding protein